MKNSKLIELLESLNKKERREFDKFLRSPYFNLREDVITLNEYLLHNMDKGEEHIIKTTVFAAIFPGLKYDEKQIRYVMSFLYKLLKNYLTLKEIESKPIQSQLYTVMALRKRNLQRTFENEWQLAKKNIEEQPHRNLDIHYYSYFLHNEQLLDSISKSRAATPGFVELSKELTHFYIANTLHQSCLAISYQNIAKLDFTPELLSQVLDYVKKNDFTDIPAVQIYYHCYLMLSSDDPLTYFQLLRKDIQQFSDYFPKSELKDINIIALNFCIRKVNEGDAQYKIEAFEFYKAGLSKGIFIEDNQLSRFTYKNIVAIGLGLNEFDWVQKFILEYAPFLAKKYRESAYCFNLALYHFKKGEYGEAMELLQQVGADDVLNNMNARRMLLRIYYDLGEFEALESLLGSFQTYIYRKKELGYQRDLYLNLIRSIRKLLVLDFKNKNQVAQLRSEITSIERIAEKPWLLEKLPAESASDYLT